MQGFVKIIEKCYLFFRNKKNINFNQLLGIVHFFSNQPTSYLPLKWRFVHLILLKWIFFRAQEPKAPVTYCDHALSGVCRPSSVVRRPSSVVRRLSSVRLFTFSTSSPEPLDGFWWNLVWMKYSRSLTSVVVFRPDPSRGGSRAGQI